MTHPIITRFLQPAAAVLLALGSSWALAAGTVEVVYVHPDSYTDLGETQDGRDQALVVLTEHLQKMAERLPQGQRLRWRSPTSTWPARPTRRWQRTCASSAAASTGRGSSCTTCCGPENRR